MVEPSYPDLPPVPPNDITPATASAPAPPAARRRPPWLSRSTGYWLMAAFLLALLRTLVPADIIEEVYSRAIFPWIRRAYDATVARTPVPGLYLFWAVMLGLLIAFLIRCIRARRYFFRVFVSGLVKFAAVLTVLFLVLWGFNYGRLSVEESIGFEPYQPTREELTTRVYSLAAELSDLRGQVTQDTNALTAASFNLPPRTGDRAPVTETMEARVRPLLATALERHGFPAPGAPRARLLEPKGVLLRISTAGVYWPWAGEGNVDAGLLPLQRPPIIAHELAHAYGFGDEGTASFLAYLAGRETSDPALAYAFGLSYWRRLAGRLRYADPEGYTEWRENELDPGIRNDLEAIYANAALYEDIAPVLRDATYTAYLKAQGIHEGLLNYGRVVQLVEGYNRK